MKHSKKKYRHIFRSAITGCFVNPLYAAMFPQYTIKQRLK